MSLGVRRDVIVKRRKRSRKYIIWIGLLIGIGNITPGSYKWTTEGKREMQKVGWKPEKND
jgi:hypothetical protein